MTKQDHEIYEIRTIKTAKYKRNQNIPESSILVN